MANQIGLVQADPWLEPYADAIRWRMTVTQRLKDRVAPNQAAYEDATTQYAFFGLHQQRDGSWLFREWAPAATAVYFLCDANNWQDSPDFLLQKKSDGVWELSMHAGALAHGAQYKLHMYWDGGDGFRIPAYAQYVLQDAETNEFNASVWAPKKPYAWKHKDVDYAAPPLIYEAHVGMASEAERVATYKEFTRDILPYIKKAGYNTIQLMGIQEHPYYGSFGYHVSSFYAASSRFGAPDDLKELIDTAHGLGLRVIMDLVHSHAVKNEVEGLSRFDGTLYQYFHDGGRGNHPAWDSRCFDYSKPEVARFLLSNCRFWIDEYHVDGYRFDGVTSMLYTHHGLEKDFTHYDHYFSDTDQDAISYLSLANELIHETKPGAITIAEEMSGMPGLVLPPKDGGIGFDYRLSMGVPDLWIKYIKELPDEQWDVAKLLHELTQHRPEEKTISYAESHDQALVGDKTIIFRLIDKDMYWFMSIDSINLVVERGLALHKMIRLLTAATNNGGYLAFMGNEFGHPEWIDFPREGNDWSYKYARRQWHLVKDPLLAYQWLAVFDRAMLDIVAEISDYVSYAKAHTADQVVSFVRNDYVFVYNFHPSQSFASYGLPAPDGSYKLVMNSDEPRFGGQGRIDPNAPYQTNEHHMLEVYIPARTAAVYKRIA